MLVGALLLGGLYLGTRPAAEEPADLVLPAASAVAVEPLASAGEPAVGASPVGPVPAPGTAPPVAAGEEELTVHVVGAVAQPGVVRVPAPARAVDAVEAAGGLLPEADPRQVNLARPLADGEQVAVPREGEPLPVPPAGPPGADAPTGAAGAAGAPLVDLNRADAATLQTLPGIGPVLAERIVQRREEVGPFERVDDLTTVSGIGTQVLDGLRERATV